MKDQLALIEGNVPSWVYRSVEEAYEEGTYSKPLRETTDEELKKAGGLGNKAVEYIRAAVGTEGYESKLAKLSNNNRELNQTIKQLQRQVDNLQEAQPILELANIYDEIQELAKFHAEVKTSFGTLNISFNTDFVLTQKIDGYEPTEIHSFQSESVRNFCNALLEGMQTQDRINILINKTERYATKIKNIYELSAKLKKHN